MGGIGKSLGKVYQKVTKATMDDALGFDPNGGGFTGVYDTVGMATTGLPLGSMGGAGVNIANGEYNKALKQGINGAMSYAGVNLLGGGGGGGGGGGSGGFNLGDLLGGGQGGSGGGIGNILSSVLGGGGQQGGQGGGAFGQLLGGVGAGVAQAQKNDREDKLADRLLSYVDKAIGTQQGMYDKSLGLQNKVSSESPRLIDNAQNQAEGFLKSNTANGLNALTAAEGRSLDDLAQARAMSSRQLEQGFEQGIQNLQPYKTSGDKGLTSLTDLTLNPQAQADLIQKNPFYNSLVNDAQSRLMKNQATRGKLGSGDTAKALQDEVLKIGSDLMQQEIGNRNTLANYGMNASQGQANLNQGLGSALSGLYGNNAQFGAGIRQNTANNVANMNQGLGNSLSNMANNNAQFKSGMHQAGANNITNLNTGMGNTLSNLFKEQSDIVGNKMANQNNPFQAGISQFLQPTQGQQQSGGGLGGILGNMGGLFGGGGSIGGSGGGFNLGSIFGGGGGSSFSLPSGSGGSTFSTGGSGSFGNLSTSGFGF
jgi:hypothetical protein